MYVPDRTDKHGERVTRFRASVTFVQEMPPMGMDAGAEIAVRPNAGHPAWPAMLAGFEQQLVMLARRGDAAGHGATT